MFFLIKNWKQYQCWNKLKYWLLWIASRYTVHASLHTIYSHTKHLVLSLSVAPKRTRLPLEHKPSVINRKFWSLFGVVVVMPIFRNEFIHTWYNVKTKKRAGNKWPQQAQFFHQTFIPQESLQSQQNQNTQQMNVSSLLFSACIYAFSIETATTQPIVKSNWISI